MLKDEPMPKWLRLINPNSTDFENAKQYCFWVNKNY